MRRIALLLATVLLAAVLLASGTGPVAAQPGKNQIEVTTDQCSNGETYTFVLNGESNVGQIEGTTSNVIVVRSEVTFLDPKTGEPLLDPETGEPLGPVIVDNGNKKGSEDELITCTGETTTELFGLGLVTADFEIQFFVTPRGNQ